jgi:hypothetical protein
VFGILNDGSRETGTENPLDGKLLFLMGTLRVAAVDVPNAASQLIDVEAFNHAAVRQSGLLIAHSNVRLCDRTVTAANS